MAAYPTGLNMSTELRDTEGEVTVPASGGIARTIDHDQSKVYEMVITHTQISAAQKATIDTFFDTNRRLLFTFDPELDTQTYNCLFLEAPTWRTRTGITWTGRVRIRGTRV